MEVDRCCKLVLLGNGSVGKTSIVKRFSDDGFQRVYKQTIGCDFFEKAMDFRGKGVKMSVWDIGGQSLSSNNLPNYVMGSTIIFLCYDVTSANTFGDLQDWLSMVRKIYDEAESAPSIEDISPPNTNSEKKKKRREKKKKKSQRAEIFLVGNKIDLISRRQVKVQEHDKFIRQEKLNGGFFVSAGSGENVLTVFYKVASASVGVELTPHELEFTKKVLTVKLEGENKGKLQDSEKIEEEDGQAHDDLMRQLQGGGGRDGGCNCAIM